MKQQNFYKVHQSKPFYDQLCGYLSSGPIEVMILEAKMQFLKTENLMGATDPKNAKEGTIRKLYGISIDKNSVHGSTLQLKMLKLKLIFFLRNKLFNNSL